MTKLTIKLTTANQIKEDVEERLETFMTGARGRETSYMRGHIDAYKLILGDINLIKRIYNLTTKVGEDE